MSHVYVPTEYMAAVAGETPHPSPQRYRELNDTTNYMSLRTVTVQKIIEGAAFTHRQKRRPVLWVSAWDYLEKNLKLLPGDSRTPPAERTKLLDLMHTRALSLALDEAKTMTTYWGVDDPETHSYCTECMQVRPLEEFETGATCLPCFNQRRGL